MIEDRETTLEKEGPSAFETSGLITHIDIPEDVLDRLI